ncbi:hypothetical protein WJX81_006291 [Elliptochloris bilobata]|uniref:SRPBCC family protein n=1 Tax=Elliptochloris bilobata TaxID=381761 RepID=A0AAW1QIN7_9CHLO
MRVVHEEACDSTNACLCHIAVHVSGVVEADCHRVWAAVRDFGSVSKWFPAAEESVLQAGDEHTVVGAVRHVAFHKAGSLRGFYEQLVALDEGAFRQTVRVISHPDNSNPFPGCFLNYVATIELFEVTLGAPSGGPATLVDFHGTFDTDPHLVGFMRRALRLRYEAGVRGLEALMTQRELPLAMDSLPGMRALIGVLPMAGERQRGGEWRSCANVANASSVLSDFGPERSAVTCVNGRAASSAPASGLQIDAWPSRYGPLLAAAEAAENEALWAALRQQLEQQNQVESVFR